MPNIETVPDLTIAWTAANPATHSPASLSHLPPLTPQPIQPVEQRPSSPGQVPIVGFILTVLALAIADSPIVDVLSKLDFDFKVEFSAHADEGPADECAHGTTCDRGCEAKVR